MADGTKPSSYPMPGQTEFSAAEEKGMRHAPNIRSTQVARLPPPNEDDDSMDMTRYLVDAYNPSDDATDEQ